MKFKERVHLQEFKLNDTDDSIIEFVLANKKNMSQVTIGKIASALFISPNAIMRTARKLGYSGFAELKYAVAEEENKDQVETVEHHVLAKMPKNIIRSLDVIDDEMLDSVVLDMLHAKKVILVGVGESVYFCEMLGKNLRCLDKEVEYYQQIHDMEYSVRKSQKEDIVIFISASGENQRMVQLVKKAEQHGSKTVSITSYGVNPLSQSCQKSLNFWGDRRVVNGYNVTDRSGLMMLIRMLSEKFWEGFCV